MFLPDVSSFACIQECDSDTDLDLRIIQTELTLMDGSDKNYGKNDLCICQVISISRTIIIILS